MNATTTKHTTKHTCGGPVFGKRTAGCPRCDELAAGAAPVQWNVRNRRDERVARALLMRELDAALAAGERTCTIGEW